MNSKREPFVRRAVVAFIVWIIYSAAGMFVLSVGSAVLVGLLAGGRGGVRHTLDHGDVPVVAWLILEPGYWGFLLLLSLLFGLVGPGLYQRHIRRGRGALDEIRDASEYDMDDTGEIDALPESQAEEQSEFPEH